MVANKNSLRLIISYTTIFFAVLSLIITLSYSIINWGQIGIIGGNGLIGEKGPQGLVGSPNSMFVRACLTASNVPISISPSVLPEYFSNKDTVFFDIDIIGRSELSGPGIESIFDVFVISDGVQMPFIGGNKLTISFEPTISFITIRATKGINDNSLVLSTLQSNVYTNSSSAVSNPSDQLIALNIDFGRQIWLSFQRVGTNNTILMGKILSIPQRYGSSYDESL